ncbi:MAG: uroporphyrinogen-III synthase [Longimicrobiales bacterium]
MRVAVTRPRERTGRTCHLLRDAGFIAAQRSLLRFEVEAEAVTEAAQDLHSYDWVVLTSAEAVRSLAGARRAVGGWPAGLKAACVGPATANAAARAGLQVALVPSSYDGASLAAELAAVLGAEMAAAGGVRGARCFWPRAEAANMGLAEALRAAGAVVTDVVAYRTIPHGLGAARLKRDIEAGHMDAVLFFAPSAVDAFVALVGVAVPIVIGVIGRTTGERVRSYGLPVHVQPATHTIKALVDALHGHMTNRE